MTDEIEELAKRLVVGHKRDGRAVYDEQAKTELVLACTHPGASVSGLARECGVNANQLERWVREQERKNAETAMPAQLAPLPPEAFVPVRIESPLEVPGDAVLEFKARLPNGVVVELGGCTPGQARELLEVLGGLRCSASTKG